MFGKKASVYEYVFEYVCVHKLLAVINNFNNFMGFLMICWYLFSFKNAHYCGLKFLNFNMCKI